MRVVVTDAEVTMADVLSLRLAISDPLAEGTRLVLRQRGGGAEVAVALGAPGAEVREASVAVSLAPLALTAGRWDAYLEHEDPPSGPEGVARPPSWERSPDRTPRRTRVQCVDPGFSLDRLDAYALSRRTLAYRAYRTRNGYLAVKVAHVEPGADVRAVWFREGRFEVTGLLAYTGFVDDDSHHTARLALRRAEGPETAVTATATVKGVRFHAALSLCDVLAATPEYEGVWEPSLEVDGLEAPLPLGARIDDVDGKGRRVQYPDTRVDGVPVRPCYTSDDELRLEVGG
ncbi:hypothetical protein Ssi03_56500 [Sphaerisporangium siamense]|uniref:Uncharacterized protein n=1 Tax=Sphaerisporangium siamense TaxID=795645 RepID=A0A7W7D521_9ACTN|nr:hypothetical protein [Sphaerisporangium siamense]MBB4700246.1 hypothetical protein [Sphaerisporangium siamense]GII87660.1 hypothetical protein Ssi03_56500 [Sphaerisporangium siamense]